VTGAIVTGAIVTGAIVTGAIVTGTVVAGTVVIASPQALWMAVAVLVAIARRMVGGIAWGSGTLGALGLPRRGVFVAH
ncbi:MAG: hypothetical protein WCR07_15090, partial [Verrucomicrobiota bacterium]